MNQIVSEFIERVTPAKRRRDAETMLALMSRVTGLAPQLHGTIIGFGQYHYKYESGREGDSAAAAFAPRKAAMTIYLVDGISRYARELEQLGPHSTGVGCLYLKDLEQNDLSVLESIVKSSFATLSTGTYSPRAREGEPAD